MEEITQLKKDVHDVNGKVDNVNNKVENVSIKVDRVLTLLEGDRAFGESGFVKTVRETIKDHEERLVTLEEEKIRNSLLKGIIWWLIGSVILEAAGIIVLLTIKSK